MAVRSPLNEKVSFVVKSNFQAQYDVKPFGHGRISSIAWFYEQATQASNSGRAWCRDFGSYLEGKLSGYEPLDKPASQFSLCWAGKIIPLGIRAPHRSERIHLLVGFDALPDHVQAQIFAKRNN